MADFKDYYGKVIQLNDKVLFAEKSRFMEGEVIYIYGNCFHVKGKDGYTRTIGWFDKVIKLENKD